MIWVERQDAAVYPAAPFEEAAAEAEPRADLLVLCVAGYILTAVGRIHQLFGALEVLRPAILTGLLAIGLYATDQQQIRRLSHIALPSTKWVLALLLWMVLSVPGALVAGTSFEVVFDNFVKTVLMYLVIAACVRGVRDV
jgi:hypothetical protein